ncbi:MAG: hypothetical protein AAB047_06175, partial [Nitrospirota bacterium]
MLALAMTLMISCEQQTWESAMAAGQRALQKGDYPEAEHIFAAAVKKAESQYGPIDRHVAVALSSEAQAFTAQG